MIIDERVFEYASKDVTARDVVADLELGRVEVPLDLAGESLGVDTTWYSQLLAVLTFGRRVVGLTGNVNGLGLFSDTLQRTLDTTG